MSAEDSGFPVVLSSFVESTISGMSAEDSGFPVVLSSFVTLGSFSNWDFDSDLPLEIFLALAVFLLIRVLCVVCGFDGGMMCFKMVLLIGTSIPLSNTSLTFLFNLEMTNLQSNACSFV